MNVSDRKRSRTARLRLALVATLLCWPAAGCENGEFKLDFDWLSREKKLPPEEAPPPRSPRESDPLFAGTVGAKTLLANVEPLRLRGFGLVVGLGENGSSDCPTVIREYLTEFMTKSLGTRMPTDPSRRSSPGQLIDSVDTAVVEVQGLVMAGALRSSRIDLRVDALAGTSTRSLAGGLLLPCELRIYGESLSRDGLVAGEVLAEAQGPLFTDPASGPGDEVRSGVILAGGRLRVARDSRLVLSEPTYAMARRIERAVNERFGQSPRVAEAISKGYVTLETPPAFGARPERFLELVTRLYVDEGPAFADTRLRELSNDLAAGGDRAGQIALLIEGFGRRSIASVQPLYGHADPQVRYFAARTGLRLGDVTALPVMSEIAGSAAHPQRLGAIVELGATTVPQAGQGLVALLEDSAPAVRVAAYEALLEKRHPLIRVLPLRHRVDPSQINFILDVIDCGGPPMIFVRRSKTPRIAVFGASMPVRRPLFYAQPDDGVTITASAGDRELAVFGKVRGKLSPRYAISPRVVELIQTLAELPTRSRDERGGLALVYSNVIQVLGALTQERAIAAELVLEPSGPLEQLAPSQMPASERPETDADEPADEAGEPKGGAAQPSGDGVESSEGAAPKAGRAESKKRKESPRPEPGESLTPADEPFAPQDERAARRRGDPP